MTIKSCNIDKVRISLSLTFFVCLWCYGLIAVARPNHDSFFNGNFEDAATYATEQIQKGKDDDHGWLGCRAVCYIELKRYNEALSDLDTVLKTASDVNVTDTGNACHPYSGPTVCSKAISLLFRARCNKEMGRPVEAEQDAMEAFRLSPGMIEYFRFMRGASIKKARSMFDSNLHLAEDIHEQLASGKLHEAALAKEEAAGSTNSALESANNIKRREQGPTPGTANTQAASAPPPGYIVITPGHYVTAYEMGSSTPHQIWVPPVYGPAPVNPNATTFSGGSRPSVQQQPMQVTNNSSPSVAGSPPRFIANNPMSMWAPATDPADSQSSSPSPSPMPTATSAPTPTPSPSASPAPTDTGGGTVAGSGPAGGVTPPGPIRRYFPDFTIVSVDAQKLPQVYVTVKSNTPRTIVATFSITYSIQTNDAGARDTKTAEQVQSTLSQTHPNDTVQFNLTDTYSNTISDVAGIQIGVSYQ